MKKTMMKGFMATTLIMSAVAPIAVNAQLNMNNLARVGANLNRYVTIQPGQQVPAHIRYFMKGGKPYLQLKRNKFMKLIPLSEMIQPLSAEERLNVQAGTFYQLASNLIVSHRSKHSEVKNQGARGTCVAHASLASLERFFGKNTDLSEEYAYKMFETRLGENCSVEGLKTTNSAQYLKNNAIPSESVWEYDPSKWTADTHPDLNACQRNTHQDVDQDLPPAISSSQKKFRIGDYQLIGDNNKTSSNSNRKTIDNAKYLKSILGQGYDIVAGVYVTGAKWSDDGVSEATEIVDASPSGDGCTPGSTSDPCQGGHALVLVGYNDIDKYFIAKNSWGDGYKDDGYMKISYNYMKHYGKYGYFIKSAVKKVGNTKKTLFKGKTNVKSVTTQVKKGIRFSSGKFTVNKTGVIELKVTRLPVPFALGKMTLMIFKEGTYNRVARVDSNNSVITLKFNVNAQSKFGNYYYQVVKFDNQIAETPQTNITFPKKNL